MLGTDLLTLVLVTGLEGVPVTLAVAAPGVIAQGADENGLPAQYHSHALHTKSTAFLSSSPAIKLFGPSCKGGPSVQHPAMPCTAAAAHVSTG